MKLPWAEKLVSVRCAGSGVKQLSRRAAAHVVVEDDVVETILEDN